jgi:hypothetical protein
MNFETVGLSPCIHSDALNKRLLESGLHNAHELFFFSLLWWIFGPDINKVQSRSHGYIVHRSLNYSLYKRLATWKVLSCSITQSYNNLFREHTFYHHSLNVYHNFIDNNIIPTIKPWLQSCPSIHHSYSENSSAVVNRPLFEKYGRTPVQSLWKGCCGHQGGELHWRAENWWDAKIRTKNIF